MGVVPKRYGYFLNPKANDFDYNAIISMDVIAGNENLFYNDGNLRELYFTFFRFIGLHGETGSTIIQIAWKDGESVGINNKIFASATTFVPFWIYGFPHLL